jgi:hypothetical protein
MFWPMSDSKPEPDCVYEEKSRRCLMCREAFQSSWAGDRVCKRCKHSNGWRNSSGIDTA